MISTKRKWLYIHPSKTGGSSIEMALAPYSTNTIGPARRAGNINVYHNGRDIKHARPEYFLDLTDYYIFVTTRNPWDRVVSAWQYFNPNISLEQYLDSKNFQSPHYDPVAEWIMDYDVVPIYFENLQKGFDIVCKDLNIPQQRLPHIAKTEHDHYSVYYTDKLRQRVAEKYKADLECFGYEYDDNNNDTDIQQSETTEESD